ncbi:hypothetical protein V8E36_004028 [Tilletia maclaganii]
MQAHDAGALFLHLSTFLLILLLPLSLAVGILTAHTLGVSTTADPHAQAATILLVFDAFCTFTLVAAALLGALLKISIRRGKSVQLGALGVLLALWLAGAVLAQLRIDDGILAGSPDEHSRHTAKALAWATFALVVLALTTSLGAAVLPETEASAQPEPQDIEKASSGAQEKAAEPAAANGHSPASPPIATASRLRHFKRSRQKRAKGLRAGGASPSPAANADPGRGASLGSARSGGVGGEWEIVDVEDATPTGAQSATGMPTDPPKARKSGWRRSGQGPPPAAAAATTKGAIPPRTSPPSQSLPPVPDGAVAASDPAPGSAAQQALAPSTASASRQLTPSQSASHLAPTTTDSAHSPSIIKTPATIASSAVVPVPAPAADVSSTDPEASVAGLRRMSVLRLPQSIRTLAASVGGGATSAGGGASGDAVAPSSQDSANPHMQKQRRGGSAPQSPELLPY